MSSIVCPSCGVAHGPEQRYCLRCGTLVGERSVDLQEALAYRHGERPSVASPSTDPPSSAGPPAPGIGIWRRPATSILAAAALGVGITAGYLLEPQGGSASAPLVAQRTAAATPTTTTGTPAAATPAAGTPAAATPAAGTSTAGTPSSVDDARTTTPAAKTAATPGAGDQTASAAVTPAATTQAPAATVASSPATTSTKPTASSAKPSSSTTVAKKKTPTQAAVAGLPKIDHVWVIGIGSPVTASDSGYLGERLLAAGTELSKYTPVATDPTLGAADLVAGRAPSAGAKTIVDQLIAAKRSWRAYAPGTPKCSDAVGANPLLAFPSVASAAGCSDGVAGLSTLPHDLRSADATPAFSYVATDPTLDPAALDDQLEQVVEPIRHSAAYKASGLIAIVPTSASPTGPTGALLLSPFAASSTSIGTTFGPYSLLRTFEDLFGLDRLGHAADRDVHALGPDVLTPDD